MDVGGDLEPAEFATVLPCPLAVRAGSIDCGGLNRGSRCRIIVPWVISLIVLVVNSSNKEIILIHISVVSPNIAEVLSITILNIASWEVTKIRHKVVSSHAFTRCEFQDIIDLVWCTSISQNSLCRCVIFKPLQSVSAIR